MTEEMKALGRRALACKHWRWTEGMKAVGHARLPNAYFRVDEPQNVSGEWANALPDLSDAATRGCVLDVLRAAWRCPTIYVRQSTTRRASDGVIAWEVCDLWLDAQACAVLGISREGSVGCWGFASEAEALIGALESAPG
jgi:hypothetical protein